MSDSPQNLPIAAPVAARGGTPVLFCWSGGKDSCLALHKLRREPGTEVVALVATVTENFDRVSMHGVRRELVERQAQALGLPLEIVWIPSACNNSIYEARMRQMLERYQRRSVGRVAFGDIFLEDLRAYREANLARIGMRGVFPIWQQPSGALVREFMALGYRAVTVCVDPRRLDASFAGREIDEAFLKRLPADVDPCGENGEFHSFVFAGPDFLAPVRCHTGEIITRDGFIFCDLLPG
jgi:uncharacterized protein (TIGR00290 family)